jgi:hypothetical protein
MKNFLILFSFCFLAACNHADHKDAGDVPKEGEEHQHPGKEPAGLSLNGTAKWKADQPTFQQVKLLQAQADSLAGITPATSRAYQVAGDSLQSGVNTLIRNCRMKGADHEALHHWLEPLLKQVKELSHSTEVEGGRKLLKEVQQQLQLFDQYFEQ